MGTHEIPYPGPAAWDERRIATIEHRLDRGEDDDRALSEKVTVLIVEVRELHQRLVRLTTAAASLAPVWRPRPQGTQ